jgi:hypothetical protein
MCPCVPQSAPRHRTSRQVSGLFSTTGNVTGASFYTAPLVTNDAAVAPALESVQDQAKFGLRDYRIGRYGGSRKRCFL